MVLVHSARYTQCYAYAPRLLLPLTLVAHAFLYLQYSILQVTCQEFSTLPSTCQAGFFLVSPLYIYYCSILSVVCQAFFFQFPESLLSLSAVHLSLNFKSIIACYIEFVKWQMQQSYRKLIIILLTMSWLLISHDVISGTTQSSFQYRIVAQQCSSAVACQYTSLSVKQCIS